MGRKKRKQARKLRTQPKQPTSEINKLARELANFIATLPPIPNHHETFITADGKKGCITSYFVSKYSYCSECYADKFCMKNSTFKWILERGKLVLNVDYR